MNIHDQITSKILDQMKQAEASGAHWDMPWHTTGGGMPINAATEIPYRGINVISLWFAGARNGFTSNQWATFKQWQSILPKGARVLKPNQKASTGVVYKRVQSRKDPETGERKSYNMAQAFNLFNAQQIEGYEQKVKAIEFDPIENAEAWIMAQGADITHGYDHAAYVPKLDRIKLPLPASFKSKEGYYTVAFHELSHWTGHAKRLDRNMSLDQASDDYVFEELIAELSAAFCCAETGIKIKAEDHNSACYLNHWIGQLEGDNKYIFKASAQASKACKWMKDYYLAYTEDTQPVP
jgi:antirestriction protein ArdC